MSPAFVYFDLGNVLCFFDRAQEIRQVAEVSGAAAANVEEILIGSHGLLWRYESGEFNDQQFYDEFCRATDTRPDQALFHRANSEIFQLNTEILPIVAHLEDAQIPLGLLSNTCPTHWRTVSDGRYGSIIPQSFQKIVLSFEAGAIKPDERIFRQAIKQAGVPAERIFYVDDTPGHVEAGKRLGLDAVLYTSPDALIQELRERGVRSNV